jgi:hypothetical protein
MVDPEKVQRSFFFIRQVIVYTSMNQGDRPEEGGDEIILDPELQI